MITVVGQLADAQGLATGKVTVPYNGPALRNFDVRTEYFAAPSTEYRSVQGSRVDVDVGHDASRVIGQVKYLERNDRRLDAVCEIDASGLGEGPWYFSPSIRSCGWKEIELRGLALTRQPASICLDPVTAFPWPLERAPGVVVYQDGRPGQLAKAAYEYNRRRKPGEPLVIQGKHRPVPTPEPDATTSVRRVEYRSAAAVDFSRARRELDLIIAPAETPAMIHERGRSYTEVFAHGAFAGVEQDPGRVRVNRDHVIQRIIGKGVRFDAWSERGLEGTVRLARVQEADEALELIDLDLLAVSAGFAVAHGGDEWHAGRRRVRRALLDHVALVPDPAYEAARVTAVRGLAGAAG